MTERPAPIVVPDLHGRSDLLDVLLAAYPGRHLLFLGDYVDRGPDAPGVIARLQQQVEWGRATLLLGNHDHMFLHGLLGDAQLWDPMTVTQFKSLRAAREAAAWLEDTCVHWQKHEHIYLSHAAPHVPNSGNWGAGSHSAHLWMRPTDERTPLPSGCRLAVHGHTPTRGIRNDQADLPVLLTFEDGTQAVYLDTLAWKSGQLATLDLADLSLTLHTLTGSRPLPRLPIGEHQGGLPNAGDEYALDQGHRGVL